MHALLEELSESADTPEKPAEALMGGYDRLVEAGVPTRAAAALTGLSRATQDRRVHHRSSRSVTQSPAGTCPRPVNKLTGAEEDRVLAVLNSARFVDQAPKQVYATLLAEGTYLCSISTMYRLLTSNAQLADRRRQATHPPRAVPELSADRAPSGLQLGHHQARRPGEGTVL